MQKLNSAKFIKNVKSTLTKHGPEILTGIGIAGMVATTIFAVKATPKALALMEEKKKELEIDKLTVIDTVKTTWKCYIPTVVTGATSIACLVGASSVHVRRNAVLATAYKLSETALTEYREKVIETIGEKKEQGIRDKIHKDHVDQTPVNRSEVIITEKGNTLCYDHSSGRYFRSDIDKIKKAVNELNRRMLSDMYISLNEFYDELGLDGTSLGNELGWNIDHGLIELYFSSQIASDGTPCLVVDYKTPPKYDFERIC